MSDRDEKGTIPDHQQPGPAEEAGLKGGGKAGRGEEPYDPAEQMPDGSLPGLGGESSPIIERPEDHP